MDLDRFLQQVTDAVMGNNREEDRDRDENLRPASEDPYGDPADRADRGDFDNVRPASEDPYGDPADRGDFANARPASEDPYGDPADQENA